jgi:hypothetical protein
VHFVWAALIALGVIFLSALLLTALALLSPVVFIVDSAAGRVSIRWLGALEYRRPLPWQSGEARFSIAGMAFRHRTRKPKRQAAQAPALGGKPGRSRAALVRFLRRCLGEPMIRRVMAKRLRALARGTLRSVAVTWRRIGVSLPDPAWNGMLAGWLAWQGGGKSPVQMNFQGENELFLEVRFYPYRMMKALLVFSAGLPYRALWREWRAASAVISA